ARLAAAGRKFSGSLLRWFGCIDRWLALHPFSVLDDAQLGDGDCFLLRDHSRVLPANADYLGNVWVGCGCLWRCDSIPAWSCWNIGRCLRWCLVPTHARSIHFICGGVLCPPI